jgi:hypothetical protein
MEATMKKMTLGLFVGRDLMSHLIATDLLPFFSSDGHEVIIFNSAEHETFIPENREFRNYLFFSSEIVKTVATKLSNDVPEEKHFWAPTAKQIEDKFGYKTIDVENINHQNFIKKMTDLGVTAALNIGFEQKFKKPLFNYFDLKKADGGFALNLHFGLLPHYRGVMPLFRAMVNGEKHGGFTLHHLEDNTHTGPIVASDKYEIDYTETMFTNLMNNYGLAVAMILNQILDKEGKLAASPQSVSEGTYFTYPTSKEVSVFLGKGLNFYEEDSLLSLMAHIFLPTDKHDEFYGDVVIEAKRAQVAEEREVKLATVIPLMAYRQKRAVQ